MEKAFALFSISAHETLISAICGRNSKEIPKCLTEIVIIGISNPGSNFLDLNRRILQQFFRPGHSDHKEVFLNGHLIMLAKKACEILLGKEVLLRITADLKGLWIVLVNVLPDPGDNFIRGKLLFLNRYQYFPMSGLLYQWQHSILPVQLVLTDNQWHHISKLPLRNQNNHTH